MSEPLRVLVVEDEVELAAVIISYFEHEGYLVDSAIDGPTAVELARAEQPDLIILDLMLPGFDGIEVCRQVRTFSNAYIQMKKFKTVFCVLCLCLMLLLFLQQK